MTTLDIFTKALESEAAQDLLDQIVMLRIKKSRDMCIEMREKLDKKRVIRELHYHEEADWNEFVLDIAAFNRILEYYGDGLR